MNKKLLWGVAGVIGLALILAIAISVAGEQEVDESLAFGEVTVEGTSLVPFADAASDPAIGAPAPTLSGVDWKGGATTIEADGRPKVIVFLAHWCPHCQDEVPELQAWVDSTGGDPRVDLYAVATSTSRVRPNFPPGTWLEGEGWTSPTVLDDEAQTAGRAFGVTAFPFWVIVDESGDVVGRLSGRVPAAAIPGLFEIAATGGGALQGGSSSENE
jgi:thiol-disulfide isomerase/thioredoxin